MKLKIATAVAALATITSIPGTAIIARPATVVGPPEMMIGGGCPLSITQPGGAGPGAAIPFRALMLGAPVVRTATSFTTGGGGTSGNMVAAQRKAAGLPYEPPAVNPEAAALPATFAADRSGPAGWAPYQRLPLTESKRVADRSGLIFSLATSPTRGRIAALVLYMTGHPTAPPRLRVAVDGPSERGCRKQVIHVYAPAMSASALNRLVPTPGRACSWTNLAPCTRAQRPHGRVLFVSAIYGATFEYRWVDYDLLTDWQFARAGAASRDR